MSRPKWIFIHSKEKKQTEPFDTVQAREFIASISSSEHALWYAWKEGLANWVPLKDCPELSLRMPPPPLFTPLETPSANSSQAGQERRKYPRHAVRLKIIVTSQTQTFRSFTQDISIGGLLLESKVPWSIAGSLCQIFITAAVSDESIEFRARVLSDPKNPFRIEFIAINIESQKKLDAWLRQAQEISTNRKKAA